MSRRTEIYRFRLTPEEQDRLEREARERGLGSKADRIREALGWDTRGPRSAPAGGRAAAVITAPPPATADPEREPGNAALEALAKRIHGSEGVPKRIARNRAKERLQSADEPA